MELTLHHPLQISPRLLPGLRIGDDWLTVAPLGRVGHHNRILWIWRLDIAGQEYSGTDLSTGVGTINDEAGYRAALGAMLSFLSAGAEAYRYGPRDDGELFEEAVLAWADQHDDELGMLSFDLEGDDL
jgi:hypothetical protein